MRTLKIIFLLPLFFASVTSHAQVEDYDIRYFTKEDGLSHNETGYVFQDSKDFIWVGTRYGLNKFDGNQFKIFTKRKNGLVQNQIGTIHEDQNYKLWICHDLWGIDYFKDYLQISIFDPESETAIPFNENFPNAPFDIEDVQAIKSDKENNIWIITQDGQLYCYKDDFMLINKNKTWGTTKAMHIIEGEEIWIASSLSDQASQIQKLNTKGEVLKTVKVPFNTVSRLGQVNDHSFYLNGSNPPFIREGHFYSWEGNVIDDNIFSTAGNEKEFYRPYKIKREKELDQIWFLGGNKLAIRNQEGKLILDLSERIFLNYKNYYVHFVCQDNFGNIWVSSNQGLVLLTPKKNLF